MSVTVLTDSSIDVNMKIKPDSVYYGTVVYINHLLNLSEHVKSETKKNQILLKMFEHLISDPMILVHVPFFRNSVINKISQIEEQIAKYKNTTLTVYDDMFNVMKHSIKYRIKDSRQKNVIMSRLNLLSDEIDNYNFWVESIECMAIMNTLRKVIEEIKAHPEYVV